MKYNKIFSGYLLHQMIEWWVKQHLEDTDGPWNFSLLAIQPPDVASPRIFYWELEVCNPIFFHVSW